MKNKIISSLVVVICISIYTSIAKSSVNDSIPLTTHLFTYGIDQGEIELAIINEASGLVASRSDTQAYWTHNDSGDSNRLYLVNKSGKNLGTFILEDTIARDWEDISIGPGPKSNKTYLYVADIGDNQAKHNEKVIYRFIEPYLSNLTASTKTIISKESIETIRFQFPDGKRDAETLMVDPISKDIFIVSKRETKVGLYVLPYPQSIHKLNTLTKVATLNFHKIVAGDISFKGNEVLLKDYDNIYYWKKASNESIGELLQTPPQRLPYKVEPQGEAIAWKLDGSGFYTLSEENSGNEAKLYFYKRK